MKRSEFLGSSAAIADEENQHSEWLKAKKVDDKTNIRLQHIKLVEARQRSALAKSALHAARLAQVEPGMLSSD